MFDIVAVEASGYGLTGTGNSPFRDSDMEIPGLEATGSENLTAIPALELSGNGLAGQVGQADVLLSALELVGAGGSGTVGRAEIDLPAAEVDGVDILGGRLDLPALDLAGTGYEGSNVAAGGAATLAIPAIELGGVGLHSTLGRADFAIPAFQIGGAGHENAIEVADLGLPAILLGGHGQTGGAGSASLVLPSIEASGAGGVLVVGRAEIAIPVFDMGGHGYEDSLAGAFGLAVNTRNRAASTYDGVPFNSVAEFNGVLLAAGAGGLFAIDAKKDSGAAIAGRVVSAKTDFGTDHMKRVFDLYAAVSSNGGMELVVTLEDGSRQFYRINPLRSTELTTARAKLAHGAKSRYWQWELSNVGGADFRLAEVSMNPLLSDRKLR